ncbi:MAG: LysR family transcriptional regulator [Chitinophagaceae bacterium]|nr:LysR family transcriptional regulator [Rubrivivax sp.]
MNIAARLDWQQLDFFRAVATASTLGHAARELGVTTSAVSQRLSSLEKACGMPLVLRSRQGLHLTETGARLLSACEDMHAAAQRAQDSLRPSDGLSGTLRITCPAGLVDGLLVPALADYLQAHPGMRYELRPTDAPLDLRLAPVDLALRFGWVVDGDFVARKLANFSEVVCASPDYLARRGTPRTPQELPAHDWVGYAGFGPEQTMLFAGPEGSEIRVTVVPRVSTTAAGSIAAWLCAGAGLSRQPEPAVREHLNAKRLVSVLDEYALPGPSLYAVYLRRSASDRVRPLLDALAKRWGT